jgi:general secretion pathway protein A
LLEELRLLANIETPTQKLLPLVLAGQPALGDRLEDPQLRQLKQRVTLRCELAPFELADTANYIASRIKTAGGTAARLFSQEAVMRIHECSAGIPRSINVICDNALLSAMALGRSCVDRANVLDVCRELRLTVSPNQPSRPADGAQRQSVAAAEPVNEEPLHRDSAAAPNEGFAVTPSRFRRFPFRLGPHGTPLRAADRIVSE